MSSSCLLRVPTESEKQSWAFLCYQRGQTHLGRCQAHYFMTSDVPGYSMPAWEQLACFWHFWPKPVSFCLSFLKGPRLKNCPCSVWPHYPAKTWSGSLSPLSWMRSRLFGTFTSLVHRQTIASCSSSRSSNPWSANRFSSTTHRFPSWCYWLAH